jgi:hypothetical protein
MQTSDASRRENAKQCAPLSCPASCGVSSTPRPFGSITAVSGILDRPVKPGDDIVSSCLTIESEIRAQLHPRRPGQAKRDPGPITTAVSVALRPGRHRAHNSRLWLWVPAFAGTTS